MPKAKPRTQRQNTKTGYFSLIEPEHYALYNLQYSVESTLLQNIIDTTKSDSSQLEEVLKVSKVIKVQYFAEPPSDQKGPKALIRNAPWH